MSLEQADAEAGSVAVAPRVTLDDIKANIATVNVFTAGAAAAALEQPANDAMNLLTICVLTTRNGFTVIGKSACASPENFNADLGHKIAYEDAVSQLWGFMGYALRKAGRLGCAP